MGDSWWGKGASGHRQLGPQVLQVPYPLLVPGEGPSADTCPWGEALHGLEPGTLPFPSYRVYKPVGGLGGAVSSWWPCWLGLARWCAPPHVPKHPLDRG